MKFFTILITLFAATTSSIHAETLVYFGTYSDAIYYATLDQETGELSAPQLAADIARPPFVAIHPSGKFLYSVSGITDKNGNNAGGVSSFSVLEDGSLKLINQQPCGGGGPCHVSLDKTGQMLMVSNYGSGSIASYRIASNGSISESVSTIKHNGSGPNKDRQASPHAHSTNTDPSNRRAYTADLGIDQIRIYDIDVETGELSPNKFPFVEMPAGGGPRHLNFHPSGKFAYSNLELTLQVSALRLDQATGEMSLVQTLSTLPPNTDSTGFSTAETLVHPSGKFLYVSNRGHNSIAIFTIDQETGKLTYSKNESTLGKTPRNFGLDPTGKFLIVANQNSNNVVVFRIDQETGLLEATGSEIEIPSAVCVRFLER